jgi:hypothetical protein
MSGLLDNLSWQFQKPNGLIYDNTQAKVLEFWPAGYTQKFIRKSLTVDGAAEEVNRQEFYKQLYLEAVGLGKELEFFPFEDFEYEIEFVPEPHNRYDPFALRIDFIMPGRDWVAEYHVGYVPAKINKNLLANKENISDIQILAVTDSLNDKFYCARIAVGYDGTVLNNVEDKVLKRFRKLG